MPYFITPQYSVAINPKVGSSTLALAVIKAFDPEMWQKLRDASYPPGMGPEDMRWHTRAKREAEPSKPVVLPVRDPVDRFRSACAQVGINDSNLDAALDSLESGEPMAGTENRRRILNVQKNEHFSHQHLLQWGETHYFSFPDQLDPLAELVGLAVPLPIINEANLRPKPTLLAGQRTRVREYYAEDIALFQMIKTSSLGLTLTIDRESLAPKPKEPIPSQVYPAQLRLWLIDHGISMAQINTVLDSVSDEKTREKLKVKWEFASMIRRGDPAINQLGAALGLKPSQIDQAFREAALITG